MLKIENLLYNKVYIKNNDTTYIYHFAVSKMSDMESNIDRQIKDFNEGLIDRPIVKKKIDSPRCSPRLAKKKLPDKYNETIFFMINCNNLNSGMIREKGLRVIERDACKIGTVQDFELGKWWSGVYHPPIKYDNEEHISTAHNEFHFWIVTNEEDIVYF